MNPNSSSYYPPRAQDRWLPQNLGRRIDRTGVWLRRTLARSPLGTPMVLSLTGAEFLLCLLIPGYAYRCLGQRALGTAFFVGWAVCGLCALVFLGQQTIFSLALSGMASCHASGLGYLALRERETSRGYPEGFLGKILIPLIAWLLCLLLIYGPGYGLFQSTVARPLFIPAQQRTVIFSSLAQPDRVVRDDLVAYKTTGFRLRGDGLMLGRVIGLPGDRIEFGPHQILVNGHPAERLPTMPTEGVTDVAHGQWLAWPLLNVNVRYLVLDGDDSAAAYLRMAHVSQQNFVGRAFHRWFFQRQDLP